MNDRNPNLTFSLVSLDNLGAILFIIFLILKLTGVINWSWLYVTMPIWIPIVFSILVVLVTFIVFFIAAAVEEHNKNKFFKKRGKK